jgi:hypothetical protein
MHPDSTVHFTVEVPEGAQLAFAIATAPETWNQPGDGVTFTIYIKPTQQQASGDQSLVPSPQSPVSNTQSLFSSYIDPKHDLAARRWHHRAVDLSAYAGQTVALLFETSAGPAGDDRYDWAGWGLPRLWQR